VQADRLADVGQRDLPDAALGPERARRVQDRGLALLLGRGAARPLEIRYRHEPTA